MRLCTSCYDLGSSTSGYQVRFLIWVREFSSPVTDAKKPTIPDGVFVRAKHGKHNACQYYLLPSALKPGESLKVFNQIPGAVDGWRINRNGDVKNPDGRIMPQFVMNKARKDGYKAQKARRRAKEEKARDARRRRDEDDEEEDEDEEEEVEVKGEEAKCVNIVLINHLPSYKVDVRRLLWLTFEDQPKLDARSTAYVFRFTSAQPRHTLLSHSAPLLHALIDMCAFAAVVVVAVAVAQAGSTRT